MLRSIGLSLGVVMLSQCSAPVSVRMEKPVAPVGAPAAPADINHQLSSIREAHDRIRRGDTSAIPIYNYSVARLIETLEASGADPWGAPMSVSSGGGIQRLKGAAPAGTAPLQDQLFPADTLAFKGDYAEHQANVAGVGAPIVLVTSFDGLGHQEMRKKLPLRNLTAIVRFEGNTATLELIDPYQVETVSLAGKSHPLAADYDAAVMLGLSKARIDKLGLARLLRPSRYNDTVHLNFLQPYDPKRIPVLIVHGLDSTPATFAPMYFELLKDPKIRENYQFWVFSYPSGYPYPYSASLLRRELDHVKRDFPDHKNMVIIGHSMGSMISRLMVTDAGDKLWIKAFGDPPSETKFTGHSRQVLLDALVFSDRKEIDRAVFYLRTPSRIDPRHQLGRPHRLASRQDARLHRRCPQRRVLCRHRRRCRTGDAKRTQQHRHALADQSLRRGNQQNPHRATHPLSQYHGRPRQGRHARFLATASCAYWSSHLDGAVSEKIVPSGHGSHAHPEGIAEAGRILLLHLKSSR